jgi:hypothetical protein
VSSKAKETRPTNEAPRLTTWSSLPVRQQDSPQVVHKPASNTDHNIAIRGKGKGKGKAIANPDSGPEASGDSDGDYPRTRMPNGALNGVGENGKGKGKGKAPAMDRFVDTDEEDLYS